MSLLARHSAVLVLVYVAILAVDPGPTLATGDAAIRTELDGQPIPAVDVGRYACHDLDFPVIRCFRSPGELDAAMADRMAGLDGPDGAAATSYVKVFPDRDLQGNPAVLSVPYDDLSVIGWNDRISSFQGVGGAGGTFFEHIYRGGDAYPFSGYQIVTYVGDRYNDTFSSLLPR